MTLVTAIIEEPSGELREIQVQVNSPLTDIPIKYLGSYKFINGLLLLFKNFPESKIKLEDKVFKVYGSDRNYFDISEDDYISLNSWEWEIGSYLDKRVNGKAWATSWEFCIYNSVDYADYHIVKELLER